MPVQMDWSANDISAEVAFHQGFAHSAFLRLSRSPSALHRLWPALVLPKRRTFLRSPHRNRVEWNVVPHRFTVSYTAQMCYKSNGI